jgi:hypothetical protein
LPQQHHAAAAPLLLDAADAGCVGSQHIVYIILCVTRYTAINVLWNGL